jgi:D-alanyl-D-alanine carboxypeptidase
LFGGKVVPPKQQKEWMELVSTKTCEPIEGVSQGDPGVASLSLAERILGPLGTQWFYEASVIGRSMCGSPTRI